MPSAAPAIDTLGRSAALERLERERFDCVVIGGGITGAGIVREGAQRGLRMVLLEARDFASGTSSRSSKLIHGGLRYLAMGDVALVRETARERKVIHRLAPHLAEPRWLVVPARSRAGLLKLQVGITSYEKLGGVAERDLHRNWSRDELAQEEPILDRERFAHACVYREYLTDDARLVLANLRAAVANGAEVMNHVGVESIPVEGGRATGVMARCHQSGREIRVRARCVINAAGPWVDAVRQLEDADAAPRLHISKGIHVVVPASRLPVRNMLILNSGAGRSIFVIRRGQVVYLGTTDTTYERGAETWPEITAADVDYLLAPVARDCDVDPLRPTDVASAWAGLRPLIAEPGKGPTEISRKDEVWIGRGRVVTIAGGKLTGFRLMAQSALAKAAEACELDLAPALEADAEPLLPGGDFDGELDALAERVAKETGVSARAAARLARLYGAEAAAVVNDEPTPLVEGAALAAGEVDWAVRSEGAATVEDVLYRRTAAAFYELDAREAAVEPIAARMAELLGWDEERRRKEVEETRELLDRDLAFADSGFGA